MVCRAQLDPADGLRVVLDPESRAVIDWSGKLPGRGAHACATRVCLEGLQKRGALARSFKTKVTVPPAPWPLDVGRAQTAKRQRELLGLAMRAGVLKSGGNVVAGLLAKRWPRYIVLAADVGERVRSDWEERAERAAIPLFTSLLGADELGAALGRVSARSVAGVSTGGPAKALRKTLKQGGAFL